MVIKYKAITRFLRVFLETNKIMKCFLGLSPSSHGSNNLGDIGELSWPNSGEDDCLCSLQMSI